MSKAKTEHRVHVILSLTLYEKLRRECEKTGASMSTVIRRALDKGLR